MDIDLHSSKEPVGSFNTKVGELFVFSPTMSVWTKSNEELSGSQKEVTSEEFVRNLIRFVCYRETDLLNGRFKPEKPCLSREAIDEFSEAEIEIFAKEFVEHNQYLYREQEFVPKKNEQGGSTLTPEFGKEIHPKTDSETFVEYLHRLSIIDKDRQEKQAKNTTNLYEKMFRNSMSATEKVKDMLLKNQINQTLGVGDSLKKMIDSMRQDEALKIHATDAHIPQMDLAEMNRKQEERRREPFNELSAKLGDIFTVSSESASYMVDMNKIQKRIADELEQSGIKSRRFSKANIWLSIIIIILTIAALTFSYYSINIEKESKKQNNEAIGQFFGERNNLLENNLRKLNELFEKQNQIISELKLMIELDQERLKNIENEVRVSNEKNETMK